MSYPSNSDATITRDRLLGYVERIENVFAQIDDLGSDKKAIYNEAGDAGIDKTALGKVVQHRRQRGRDPVKYEELDSTVRLYLDLLNGEVESALSHARIRAHEAAERFKTQTEFFARLNERRDDDANRPRRQKVVYFLHAVEAGVMKIGVTDDLDRRIGDLARMSPLPLSLLRTVHGDHKREAEFHTQFADLRLHGEWFTADDRLLAFIRDYEEHDAETGEIIEPDVPKPLPVVADEATVTDPATPIPTAAENALQLRPFCLHADDLSKCGGMGRRHCYSCEKAHADSEGFSA